MRGFILSWLKLKRARPKLWLNSPRFCWQGGKEVWQEGCACVCVHMWGSSYFLNIIHKNYLSNKCHQKSIYPKRRGRPESAKHWTLFMSILFLSIVALIIHRPHGGGVRQCLLSPDILTTGGVHKRKKCIQKCWECSHEKLYKQLLGVFPMKVGWVSKYDTSMIKCPWFFFFWGRRQGRQPLRTWGVSSM